MSGGARASTSIAMRRSSDGSFETASAAAAVPKTLRLARKRDFSSGGGVETRAESGGAGSLEALGQPFIIVKQSVQRSADRRSLLRAISTDHFQQRDQLGRAPADADDRGGLRLQFCPTDRRWNGVTERKKSEGRFRQAAQDRQPHPGIIGVSGRDLCQGFECGGLVTAAIAERDRRVEAHTDGGVIRELDERRCGKQLLARACSQTSAATRRACSRSAG